MDTPTIDDIEGRWPTHEACTLLLEKIYWPNGPICPRCGSTVVSRHRESTRDRWQCHVCGSFAVTFGTLFHSTHIPLQRWFAFLVLFWSPPFYQSSPASGSQTAHRAHKQVVRRVADYAGITKYAARRMLSRLEITCRDPMARAKLLRLAAEILEAVN